MLQKKEVKQTERFAFGINASSLCQNTDIMSRIQIIPKSPYSEFISSCQAAVEAERSLAPCGPSYTPTHLLLTLDLHSVPLLSQQPPEASSHILKRPAENDEFGDWRLVPLYGQ